MEFEMKNNILVPKTEPVPMLVFVDETYLLDRTGFLQSAMPIPLNIYSQQLVPQSSDLLRQLGQDAKEFKGSAVKAGNANIYRQFLAAFINVSAHISDHAPVFPIVAVDASGIYSGKNYDWVYKNVTGGLANMGIHDEDQLAAEFSRQVLWIYNHYKKITNLKLTNELLLCFDNKHQYAERMQALRAMTNDKLIAPTLWQLEDAMRSFANTLFANLDPKIPIPRIDRFQFRWSPLEFGLQAADLLCHLIYCGIKHEMGIADDNTQLKAGILKEVMPAFALDPALTNSLAIGKDNQGRDDIRCTNPHLLSTFQFSPQ